MLMLKVKFLKKIIFKTVFKSTRFKKKKRFYLCLKKIFFLKFDQVKILFKKTIYSQFYFEKNEVRIKNIKIKRTVLIFFFCSF
jgi:hypothetical protein